MPLSIINVSIESELKEKAEALFKKLGLDMDSAVTLFLEEAVARGELPFDIPSEPNAETIKGEFYKLNFEKKMRLALI